MRLLPVLLWGLQAAACVVIAALTGACAGLFGMLVLGCIEEREGDAYAW